MKNINKTLSILAASILFVSFLPKNANAQAWQIVGKAGFSAGDAGSTSLAFNTSGQPYVACWDAGNSFKSTVRTFDGSNWSNFRKCWFFGG